MCKFKILISLVIIAIVVGAAVAIYIDRTPAEAAFPGAYNPANRTNQILERQANTLNRIAVALEKIAAKK